MPCDFCTFAGVYVRAMISKAKIKLIRSLELKKKRDAAGLFIAEGGKLVSELLPCFPCRVLVALPEWLRTHDAAQAAEVCEVTRDELAAASLQKSPQQALAVFEKRADSVSDMRRDGLRLALDDIQDPGNLGTILRIADWFGIKHVLCSPHCADVYNPKVVQATMGALARVQVHYVDLPAFLEGELAAGVPVYGTFLDGENIYEKSLAEAGIIVMGNEGNGISDAVCACVSERVLIPSYPPGALTSESLNVSAATAIVCAEFRRRAHRSQK